MPGRCGPEKSEAPVHDTNTPVAQIVPALDDVYGAWMRHASYVARSLAVRPIDAAALHHLAGGPLTPTQLGARVAAGSGSLTAIVDRLEEAGLVARTPHPHDRRSVSVSLTTSGRTRITAQTADLLDATQMLVERLSPSQQATVADFLQELVLVLEREAPIH